jgi:hypothetical protein
MVPAPSPADPNRPSGAAISRGTALEMEHKNLGLGRFKCGLSNDQSDAHDEFLILMLIRSLYLGGLS